MYFKPNVSLILAAIRTTSCSLQLRIGTMTFTVLINTLAGFQSIIHVLHYQKKDGPGLSRVLCFDLVARDRGGEQPAFLGNVLVRMLCEKP